MSVFILLMSCTDLDIQPTDSTTPDITFSDENEYRRFIAKVYAGLIVTGQEGPAGNGDIKEFNEGFSDYLRQYWQLQELTTDEAIIQWNDNNIRDLHNHVWTSSNQFVQMIYYRIFFQVSMANEFLKETTNEKLDSRDVSEVIRADIKEYRIEARFLRALSYWHGIDLFGNIPFYTENFIVGGSSPEQADRATLFNFIESELNAIEGEMAEPKANEYGRVDKAVLWALQTKLYLNAEVYTGTPRYTDCITACQKIINSGTYSLQEVYQHLFMADNHTSNEIIFALPSDGERMKSWGGMTYLVHAPVGGAMNDNPEEFGINGGWGGLRTTSTMVDLFPDETGEIDSRAIFYTNGQSKIINDVDFFTEGYAVPKYVNITSEGEIGSDLTHIDTDYPMFRLADVYLMYAEAVLRGGTGGDMAIALDYVNQLRERAYRNNNGNITTAELTLEFILEERGRELYWEAHRRTDLIRFNQFTENGIWPWKGAVKEGKVTESYRDLFPIPSGEIIVNTKLQQNQGY